MISALTGIKKHECEIHMCILGAIPVMCGALHCIAKSEDVCYMTCRALVPKLSKIACVYLPPANCFGNLLLKPQ